MRHLLRIGTGLVILVLLAATGLAVEGDVVFKRKGGDESGTRAAVFPHWIHRIRYKCYACHPSLFEMNADVNDISMDAIQQGRFCGVCHDNKTAWAVGIDTCNRCHFGD